MVFITIPALTWIGVMIGKYILVAYNEEFFREVLEKMKVQVEKFPEHRRAFWIKRIDDLIESLPKKHLMGESLDYAQNELQSFSKKMVKLLHDFYTDIKTFSKGIQDELLGELRKIIVQIKQRALGSKSLISTGKSKISKFFKKNKKSE